MDTPLFALYVITFLTALVLTVVTERILIPRLEAKAAQPIYEGGPSWHLKKSGTPTMGGLAFVLAITVSLGIFAAIAFLNGDNETGSSVALTTAFALLNAAIGVYDDLKKLKRQKNEGLKPIEKLILQAAVASGFLVVRQWLLNDGTAVEFSFGRLELGALYYPIALILLLGIINCANLTDGIDGLASGVSFAIGLSLFYISSVISPASAVTSVAMMGASIGFLFFNINPARIFMGDTGSLYLGALAVGITFSLGNPILIIPVGGVYVIEGVSVILQVTFFKLTGKRIFKMAPLHHHFERIGMSENKICVIAIIATLMLSLSAYMAFC